MAKAKWAVVVGLALTAACGRDNPVGPRPEEPVDVPDGSRDILAAIECTVSAIEGTMSCGPVTSGLVPSSIVGGQHRFVRLASSNVSGDPTLSADVTVQNLTLLQMATADGTTPDPNGVRVFFHTGPTNGVTVANEDGTGTFTASNQPFFQYSGAELGADQILEQGEVSSAQTWQFDMSGCTTGPPCTFSFTVFVSAITPDESPSARTVSLLQVDAGGEHTCGIGDDGKTYCWGDNDSGQLGDGTTGTDRTTPRAVNTAETFTQVSAGDLHTCAVTGGGAAFCWGEGAVGRLGNGGTTDQPSPGAVSGGLSFSSISAGGNHTCAITSGTSRAYCWGGDGDGQLGNGTLAGQQTSPDSVETALTFASISAGGSISGNPFHTCAVDPLGNAHCWGDDTNGQLGNGASITGDQHLPSPVDQTGVTGGTFAPGISAGAFHTCAHTPGSLGYCWGVEANGRVGNGSTVGNETSPALVLGGHLFTQISAGYTSSCAIEGGAAFCWGSDGNGQIGNGATTGDQTTPQPVSGAITFAQLSISGFHVVGRESGGQTHGWGDNDNGQVGDGRTTDQDVPVFVAATTN